MPCTILSRRTGNRDRKEARGCVRGNHAVRRRHARVRARRHDQDEGRGYRQRDARRFGPTRSPTPRDTNEPANAGVPGRPLRARAEGARTQGRPVRVGGDRTPPVARARCRGGADGDVPGGRVHSAGRRHRPAAVGRPHALADAFRQARACVCRD